MSQEELVLQAVDGVPLVQPLQDDLPCHSLDDYVQIAVVHGLQRTDLRQLHVQALAQGQRALQGAERHVRVDGHGFHLQAALARNLQEGGPPSFLLMVWGPASVGQDGAHADGAIAKLFAQSPVRHLLASEVRRGAAARSMALELEEGLHRGRCSQGGRKRR